MSHIDQIKISNQIRLTNAEGAGACLRGNRCRQLSADGFAFIETQIENCSVVVTRHRQYQQRRHINHYHCQ